MVKFNIGGIVFGTEKLHWWDNKEPFDRFIGNNGDPIDPTKWDTDVSQEADAGIINIQANQCYIATNALSGSGQSSRAILTLKNPIVSGKLMVTIRNIWIDLSTNSNNYIKFQVGNTSDGWNDIPMLSVSGNDEIVVLAENYFSSISAIYTTGTNWNIYRGAIIYNTYNLPNGLKFRVDIRSYDDENEGSVIQIHLGKVYIN